MPSRRGQRRKYADGEREFLVGEVTRWKSQKDKKGTLVLWLAMFHENVDREYSGFRDQSVMLREIAKDHSGLMADFNAKTNAILHMALESRGYPQWGRGW